MKNLCIRRLDRYCPNCFYPLIFSQLTHYPSLLLKSKRSSKCGVWVFAQSLLAMLMLFINSLGAQSNELVARAYAAVEEEEYALAAHLLKEAAQATTAIDSSAIYLLDAGDAYRYADHLDSALVVYKQLASYPSTSETVDSLRALAAHLTGLIYYKQEDYKAAISPYKKAIAIRDSLYPQGHNDCAKTRLNLGVAYEYLGDLTHSAAYLQESNWLYNQLNKPDSTRWLKVLLKLSEHYWNLNDPQMVRSVVSRAQPIFETYYSDDNYELGWHYYSFGANLSNTGSTNLMVEMMDASAYYYQLSGSEYEYLKSVHARATSHMEAKDYARACKDLDKVLVQLARDGSDDELFASAHYNAALSSLELGRLEYAKQKSQDALSAYLTMGDSLNAASAVQLLARIAGQTGTTKQAHEYYDSAFELILGARFEEVALDQIPPLALTSIAELLYDRADQFESEQQYKKAIQDYNDAFILIDRIRKELPTEASQAWVSSNAYPSYQRAIDICYQLYKTTAQTAYAWKALALSERAKAFSLILSIRQTDYERPRRERSLNRSIARLERSKNETDKVELGRLRLELERLKGLRVAVDKDLPNFNRDKLIAHLAQNDQSLVEFATGSQTAYRFILTPSGMISFEQLVDNEEIAALVVAFRSSIKESAYKKISLDNQQANLDDDYEVASYNLVSKLLGNAKDQLFQRRRILIVPDGVLGFLPFGALLTQRVKERPLDYQTLPYWQNDREIAYTYSASFLLELSQRKPIKHDRNLLAFAPTFHGNNQQSFSAVDGERAFPALLPLRHNEAEVKAVTTLIPLADAYIGEAANRKNFEALVEQYKVILVSSHAFVDANQVNRSFIAFSQQGDSLETDEMLYLNDLSTFQLTAELAMLSACETSIGKLSPGEGILSLARAFAAAGAASTLTTLWKIDDEATKQFTVNFFEALKSGNSRTAAVMKAQEEALKNERFSHPYYWSSMTLYGNSGTMDLAAASMFSKWRLFVFALFVCGALVFLRYIKKA